MEAGGASIASSKGKKRRTTSISSRVKETLQAVATNMEEKRVKARLASIMDELERHPEKINCVEAVLHSNIHESKHDEFPRCTRFLADIPGRDMQRGLREVAGLSEHVIEYAVRTQQVKPLFYLLHQVPGDKVKLPCRQRQEFYIWHSLQNKAHGNPLRLVKESNTIDFNFNVGIYRLVASEEGTVHSVMHAASGKIAKLPVSFDKEQVSQQVWAIEYNWLVDKVVLQQVEKTGMVRLLGLRGLFAEGIPLQVETQLLEGATCEDETATRELAGELAASATAEKNHTQRKLKEGGRGLNLSDLEQLEESDEEPEGNGSERLDNLEELDWDQLSNDGS